MLTLFFDTETADLAPRDRASHKSHHRWPHIAELGVVIVDSDRQDPTHWKRYAWLVKPDGWVVTMAATEIHGLTHAFLLERGQPLVDVLDKFRGLLDGVDCAVAHNVAFDRTVVEQEYLRLGLRNPFDGKVLACSMLHGTRPGGKRPKLVELQERLFPGNPLPGVAHRALYDTEVCARCWLEMLRRGEIRMYREDGPSAATAA